MSRVYGLNIKTATALFQSQHSHKRELYMVKPASLLFIVTSHPPHDYLFAGWQSLFIIQNHSGWNWMARQSECYVNTETTINQVQWKSCDKLQSSKWSMPNNHLKNVFSVNSQFQMSGETWECCLHLWSNLQRISGWVPWWREHGSIASMGGVRPLVNPEVSSQAHKPTETSRRWYVIKHLSAFAKLISCFKFGSGTEVRVTADKKSLKVESRS